MSHTISRPSRTLYSVFFRPFHYYFFSFLKWSVQIAVWSIINFWIIIDWIFWSDFHVVCHIVSNLNFLRIIYNIKIVNLVLFGSDTTHSISNKYNLFKTRVCGFNSLAGMCMFVILFDFFLPKNGIYCDVTWWSISRQIWLFRCTRIWNWNERNKCDRSFGIVVFMIVENSLKISRWVWIQWNWMLSTAQGKQSDIEIQPNITCIRLHSVFQFNLSMLIRFVEVHFLKVNAI